MKRGDLMAQSQRKWEGDVTAERMLADTPAEHAVSDKTVELIEVYPTLLFNKVFVVQLAVKPRSARRLGPPAQL